MLLNVNYSEQLLNVFTTRFANYSEHLLNVFTKFLRGPRIDYICNKLGTFDLYGPPCRVEL